MRRVMRPLVVSGIVAALAAPMVLSTPAQAGRSGGFHGGMGFHGGFHHHHRFFPRFGRGFGFGAVYGGYDLPAYYNGDYSSYDYPYYPYDPDPHPYYGSMYPTAAPYASGYGGAYPYPTQALGSTSTLGPPAALLPPAEAKPSASQAPPPSDPLLGLTRRPPKPASSDNAADRRLPDVRLTGIVIEPDRRIAIFAVTGTRPLELSEGETLKDWRLDSISPQKVSLSGPAGTMTLALNADTDLAGPPLPAGAATASPPLPSH
jgi:hypothetical protein